MARATVYRTVKQLLDANLIKNKCWQRPHILRIQRNTRPARSHDLQQMRKNIRNQK